MKYWRRDSLESLGVPLLYDNDDCVPLGARLVAVVLLDVELTGRGVLVAEPLSPEPLLREPRNVDVVVVESLKEEVLVAPIVELLPVEDVLPTELLDVEPGVGEMFAELLLMELLL